VAVRKSLHTAWADTPDFQQTRRYADATGCPSVLVDSHFVHLIAPYAGAPHRSIERTTATTADLMALTEHLTRDTAEL
jgi:hypothetical protein